MLKPTVKSRFKGAAGYLAAFLLCALVAFPLNTWAQSGKPWVSGGFSFSDELGGFRILDVSGSGTRSDPFRIRQVFDTANSATLVIRSFQMEEAVNHSFSNITNGAMYIHFETINNTNLPWIGFGFELQEELDKPSTYFDGLSFDQMSRRTRAISSNRFADFEDQFEPGDRLVYTDGVVNNTTSVAMRFIITDFTPVPEFYLFQDPLIPAS